ncbi:MAG: hypothetical protein PVJ73_14690 [Acidobacteriota bacterium]|jgi:hypothetical protein
MRMIGATVAVAMALALSGCDTADYVTGSQASVLLVVAAINDGEVLDSDVRNGENSNVVCPDTVLVSLAVRNKNPNAEAPRVPGAVLIQRYEVKYSRSDGRGAENQDVPHTIVGVLSTAVDVATSGTTEVPIEVVRRQAKLEPPLSNITGYDIVTMFATITISGQTVSGDSVTGSGSMQIDFANYGDSDETCPGT